ncbi:MAG: hypothetical protein WCT29_03375 [Candidatus Paceibacterota bacterium]|jgi:pimeloyl-ACP methyl ester carboxylesterase
MRWPGWLRCIAIIFVAIFGSGFIVLSAQAAEPFTEITENISENTIWTKAESPYVVRSAIYIPPEVTLTIEPGVVVKFDLGAKIFTEGRIEAEGSESEPIYFTSFYDDEVMDTDNETFCDFDDEGNDLPETCESFDWGDPLVGDWDGIYFEGSESSLENIFIKYANGSIQASGESSISFLNLNISDGGYGVAAYSDSYIKITGGTFENLEEGASAYFGELVLENVILSNISRDALGLYGGLLQATGIDVGNIGFGSALGIYDGDAIITDAVFENGSDAGVEVYGGTLSLENSLLSGFPSGDFAAYGGSANLKQVEIENTNYGVSVYGGEVAVSESSFTEILVFAVENYPSSQVDARGNWWGDASGPYHEELNPEGAGEAIYGNVSFTPWLESYPPVSCCSSVLFLPGIEASRLYLSDGGNENQLWEPNRNLDVEKLYLNSDGSSKNSGVYTRDVIQKGLGVQNIYKSFVDMLRNLVDDITITKYLLFAYDWRQPVDEIVNEGTQYEDGNKSLVDTLQSLAESSRSGKVTIVAHSNGGLLAKALLKKLQADKEAGLNNLIDSVDVLILVASPQIGTASAVPAVLHGYDQRILGGLSMNEMHARELGRNMRSAFSLLPSREYINRLNASPATFVDTAIPSNVTTKMVQKFGSAISSYEEYKDFLFGKEGRVNPAANQINLPIVLSENLFAQSENLHNDIDAWVPPETLRIIEVAGWGLDTIASFEYYPQSSCAGLVCAFTMDQRPRFTKDGDGTVVEPSALYMSTDENAEKYWVNLLKLNKDFDTRNEHKNILEIDKLNNLLKSVIKNEGIVTDDILKDSKPVDTSNLIRLSIHSPITLDAYDAEGNHTGKVCSADSDFCYVEENIVNSSYMEFGEGKYISLPEEEFNKVKLLGTGVGTFTYESEQVMPNETSTTSYFLDIPVTTQTQAEITLNNTTKVPELKLDVTGDGVTDFTILPKQQFDPVLYLQIVKATINSLELPPAKIKAFNNKIDSILKKIAQGKIDKAKLKAEKFRVKMEKIISKPDSKKPRPKQISKTDAQLLLDMFNKLLDNLN